MKRLVLLFLLAIPICCTAQKEHAQARIDSLLAALPGMKEDTNAVKLLHNISNDYTLINPDEAIKYAKQELNLAQKIGRRADEASAYISLGNSYMNRGDYPVALENFFKALKIYEELGNKEEIGASLVYIGSVFFYQKDYSKVVEYYSKGLKIAEERGDKNSIGNALVNLGDVYGTQGKYREALEYYLKALKIAEEQGNGSNIVAITGNIGIIYHGLDEPALALAYYQKSLRMAEAIGDKQFIAINLGNIGEAYLGIAKDTAYIKPDSLVPAGKAAILAKAIEYLSKGITGSREIHFSNGIQEFSQNLSEAYALQGNYKGALEAYKQYTSAKDSTFSIENNTKISNLETKRAVELKDKDIQIAKLKKRNERILFGTGIAVLLFVMVILFRNFKKQQRSNQLLAQTNTALSNEKKRSDDLLLNILPAEVAQELKDSGASAARQYDDVSVLFTDFVDFTGTAEKMSPKALVKELQDCFTAFDTIIERNGLEKIKTIGDAYMAVCGLPASDPDHAKKTVQAAIEIRDFIDERKKNEKVFRIRIGVNSGPVVAGIVGVKKFAYDIWGDTVNTANRMEQHGEEGKVNISHTTHEAVKDLYRCEYRGKIAAKNKGEIEMYFAEALVDKSVELTA